MTPPVRATLRALALLLCVALLSPLAALPAAAEDDSRALRQSSGVTTLCWGYNGCKDAGMGNAGYKNNSGTMYWQMYSGHNCTNYAAYRMVKSGMPNQRPWSGGGNAMYWGTQMSDITDAVPAVGAVAWWKANTGPAGSAGHVAYVEAVVSSTEIIISQDSWGGEFSWARVVKTGGSWPNGFIHFNDVTLENAERPTISGTPKVGAVLNADPGSWTPDPTAYSYQWLANGAPVANATGPTLKLRLEQEGARMAVRVTAEKPGYPATAKSSVKTPLVEPGQITNTVAPVLSGVAKVDTRLTVSPGSWTPTPTTLAYQWQANGSPIAGATTTTYVPGPEQLDKTITVTVTAARSGYDDVVVTPAAVGPVAPGTFTVNREPRLSGRPRLGETLALAVGQVSPPAAEQTITWRREGTVQEGVEGTDYQLSRDDLGSHVSAVVTLTRPGYTPLTLTAARTALVKTEPKLRVRTTRPRRGVVTMVLRMRAPGVDEVAGTVQIISRGEVLKELVLRHGTRSTKLRHLASGPQKFKIRYLATRTVTATSVKRKLTVR